MKTPLEIEELLQGLKHEIRNPINAAKLQLEMLARHAGKLSDKTTRDRMVRRAEVIQGELDRVAGLVDDFLLIAGPQLVDPKPEPLRPLIDRVLEPLRREAAQQAIRVEIDVHDDTETFTDARHLEQILGCVIENALDAMRSRPGGQLTLRAVQSDDHLEVVIMDSGPGFSEEAEERAFEPFFTTKDGGRGLGLTIARRLTDLQGGDIEAGSVPGGARVTLRLPAAAH